MTRRALVLIMGLLLTLSIQAKIEVTKIVACVSKGNPQQAFAVTAEGTAGPFKFYWIGPEGYTSREKEPIDIELPGSYRLKVLNGYGCVFRYNVELTACTDPASDYNNGLIAPGAFSGAYVIQFIESFGDWVMRFLVRNESPCVDIAGPDRAICIGDKIELGTGCLPWPHPVDGVEYCYAWEPYENLYTHLSSSMPTVFPTETTTYTVYVTDSNGDLIAEDQVTVKVNSIKIKEWEMPRICPGESVAIAPVILSEGNYSYLWENGDTTSTVEVELLYYTKFGLNITNEDTGCKEHFDFPVFVERPPDIKIISTYSEICERSVPESSKDEYPVSRSSNKCRQTSTNLYAGTGIPGYSYKWSTGETTDKITVDEAGYYWVTVTEDGEACSATDLYKVHSCASVEIEVDKDATGASILKAVGDPNSTYEWHDGSIENTIKITGDGFYSVTLVNSEGCIAKDGFAVKGY